ncbi:hypothetical protein P5V15_011388 [Pogonomyrmex californicus]
MAGEMNHSYEETLRLLEQFLNRQITEDSEDVTNYVKELHPFVFRNLATTDHVFIRHDGPKEMLRPSYDSPFAVTSRGDKNFVVRVHGKNITIISDDRSQLPGSIAHNKADVNMSSRQSENT